MAELDLPTAGRAFIGEEEIGLLDDARLTDLRRDRVGFMFQSFNLVPTLTAGENIILPGDLAGTKIGRAWFDHLVEARRLRPALHHPSELSGGQQQGTACARTPP
jgi:putative ABC transport system ATP-binding protein